MRVVARLMFQALGGNKSAKTLASRYGLRGPHGFGRRFVAGESVADAIEVARQLEASGFQHTLAVLGETAATMADADRATRAHLALFTEIAAAGIGRDVSVKLTQLGLTVDRATCVDNLRRILDGAAAHELFVRIDMEDSRYTQVTFDIFDTLWQLGYRNAGIAVQSYLPRSMEDVKRLNTLGARVRLVKGAYREPRKVAYQKKEEVDAAFIEIMQVLLTEGVQPAIATQDPAMLAATVAFAAARSIGADRYEIQMVYGVRRDLQARLAREGQKVRIWVPFGREWFPYLMRRLGDRPANVGLVVRSLLRER
jgi:proline dehydrogenase